jgi:hypothetical protein
MLIEYMNVCHVGETLASTRTLLLITADVLLTSRYMFVKKLTDSTPTARVLPSYVLCR